MRAFLILLPAMLAAAPALAQPLPGPAPVLPQVLADPGMADQLGRVAGAVTRSLMNLPVGELEAAIEGRPATRADRERTIRDSIGDLVTVVAKLPDNAAEDSVSLLPALMGKADKPLREAVVHHSINGSFSIRQGNWKLQLCSGSGGWSAPRPNTPDARKLPPVQLYDLSKDVAEKTNVQADHPEVVERLTRLLEKYVADGRSTPGAPQQNAVPIELWKDRVVKAARPKAK